MDRSSRQATAREGQNEGADGAERAGFGGCGDSREHAPEHQENQSERGDHDGEHLTRERATRERALFGR